MEVTSGNTGISLSMASAVRGYQFIGVMPEFVSREKQDLMRSYGARLVLTPASKDIAGAVEEYERLKGELPDAWLPGQFQNPDNIEAHRTTTGREIIQQMDGRIDAVVAGIGTGGTLLGIAKALEYEGIDARVIGVEPYESSILSGGKPGYHSIQGIGEGFIPDLVEKNLDMIDEVIRIRSQDAKERVISIARDQGYLVGISSGANVLASAMVSSRYERVVTLLPDRGERYFSMHERISK